MKSARIGHVSIRTLLLMGLSVVVACSPFGKTDPDKARQKTVDARAGERVLVAQTLAEPERTAVFLTLIDERDVLEKQYTALMRNHLQRLTALSANYHSSRADFEEALQVYNHEREWVQTAYIDIIEKMKRNTTTAEWKVISKYQLSQLKPRVISQQGLRSMYQ